MFLRLSSPARRFCFEAAFHLTRIHCAEILESVYRNPEQVKP